MKTAIVNRHSPFQIDAGREALDLALILATYEQDVALFFQGQGVLQLKQHDKARLDKKDYTATFKALELYDVEHVFALKSDIDKYQVDIEQLDFAVTLLNNQEYAATLAGFDQHWSF
ncbi:sulfurtransferase complex subunit TusC [Saccharobesus litoralis]|uniref:Sulfurtransferase complex subunit TusC n=1 Tax=Saccharobesus litoralis TaxID=2172099 RepID=A0A2S0VV76_9ALTE|nr:sulfurtransferase complex subunit TusC [Saccharobesus litoralis]AWB68121.1 sulfurtransferase complex subunit TusC [Saccharobesus litoralis]